MSSFCSYIPKQRSRRRKVRRKKPKPKVKSSFLSQLGDQPLPRKRCVKREQIPVLRIDTRDFNIFHIDSQIRKKLELKISTIPELQKDLCNILWILKNGENPVDKTLAGHQATIIRNRIRDLETTFELGLYLFRTSDILDEYRKIVASSGPQSFVGGCDTGDSSTRKKELSSQFMCIAQEYAEIEFISQPIEKIVCQDCGSFEFNFDDESSIYICKKCGTEVEILDDSPSFKDTDRVNMSSRFSYSRRGHFTDAMKRFQGIQNIDPKKISRAVKVLKEEMKMHSLTIETVTKDHIYMFLSEKRLSRHYEDLNLLYHIITGKPCPNITSYEDELLDLFDKQEEKLDEVLEDERDNSLNVNYKLYKLLQKVGYPCRKDDFYILKTKTKEDEHDTAMKKAWKLLGSGWEWIGTF